MEVRHYSMLMRCPMSSVFIDSSDQLYVLDRLSTDSRVVAYHLPSLEMINIKRIHYPVQLHPETIPQKSLLDRIPRPG